MRGLGFRDLGQPSRDLQEGFGEKKKKKRKRKTIQSGVVVGCASVDAQRV
jgi:hypothetical protein